MPPRNGRANNGGKVRPKFDEFKFVSYTLVKSEKALFEAWWTEHAADANLLLAELVNSGYKFSASWDDANDCYIVSFTCLDERSANYCLILSSRSDDLAEATGLNLFKHYKLFLDTGYPVKESNSWG